MTRQRKLGILGKDWDRMHQLEEKELARTLPKRTLKQSLDIFRQLERFANRFQKKGWSKALDEEKIETLSRVHRACVRLDEMKLARKRSEKN